MNSFAVWYLIKISVLELVQFNNKLALIVALAGKLPHKKRRGWVCASPLGVTSKVGIIDRVNLIGGACPGKVAIHVVFLDVFVVQRFCL